MLLLHGDGYLDFDAATLLTSLSTFCSGSSHPLIHILTNTTEIDITIAKRKTHSISNAFK